VPDIGDLAELVPAVVVIRLETHFVVSPLLMGDLRIIG
jgi:hypothetical protein